MKKIVMTLFGALLLAGCQNELYTESQKDNGSGQGAYIAAEGPIQIFVEEGREYFIKDVKVGLTVKEDKAFDVPLIVGDQTQLDEYNKKNNTSYLMLPPEMYEIPTVMKFKPNLAMQSIPVSLKNLKFSLKGDYALPIRLSNGSAYPIPGEEEALLILEKRTRTKVLLMNGSGSESDKMFPQDFKVKQWTMEAMVKRSAYNANNRSIGGTKLVANAGPHDEIYTRFGDVTIDPNQLQIKTGSAQIDVPKNKFAAKPNEWYMLTFVYDGKTTYVYVNGDLVASSEIRDGEYGLIGFWIGGANEYIREVRFWDIARTQQQIKAFTWKMVNPDEKGLLLYYPCNGLKRNHETGEITEDDTMIWNWATYYNGDKDNLNLPMKGRFDDNGGKMFVFPAE
ncbi:BT_3987 domain-containing protein [Bacteroides congonensis]